MAPSSAPHRMRKGFTPQEPCLPAGHSAATLASDYRLRIPHLCDTLSTLTPRESMTFPENRPMNFLLLGSSDFIARRIPSRSPTNETVTGSLCHAIAENERCLA